MTTNGRSYIDMIVFLFTVE